MPRLVKFKINFVLFINALFIIAFNNIFFQSCTVQRATRSLRHLKKFFLVDLMLRALDAALLNHRNVMKAAKAAIWLITMIMVTILVTIILLPSGKQVNFIETCFFQYF